MDTPSFYLVPPFPLDNVHNNIKENVHDSVKKMFMTMFKNNVNVHN